MKIRKPADVVRKDNSGPRPLAYDLARKAAIEKRKTPYIHLVCGHLITWEDDEVYSAWRPNKRVSFCEKCGKWVARALHKKKNVLPDNPLF